MDWIKEIEKQNLSNEVMSFEDFMHLVQEKPSVHCRPNCIYLKDMFDYFGRNEDGSFKLFQKQAPGSPAVQGQEHTQKMIYKNLSNFTEEGFNNKFILLVGPNGSSKTSLIRKIMSAAEEYSHTDDGALYTFSWIFPIDNFTKGGLGFNNDQRTSKLNTFAFIDEKEISAILPSDLKDHPILLIPKDQRKKIIEEAISNKNVDIFESIKKSYLYEGDLSKRNKLIFDSLLKRYQGNYLEVYKHIRVERFYIDKKLSSGAVTIEPQMHVDARLQQITMDKRLATLPPSIQSLNLFSVSGEAIMANRGILEFSDLLKRPLDAFKYLLTTMESKAVNLGGIVCELDVFFIGTSNELHLEAFKKHPDFNSFRGRFNFIKVPYLLDARKEESIYEEQIHNLRDRCYFEQHALSAICLWSVLTRLRKPDEKNYEDKKISGLITKLNPLEKALFLSLNILPESFGIKEKQRLVNAKNMVKEEYINDHSYEGKFGISPREIKQIIYDLSSEHLYVTFVEVLEYLRGFIQKKSEYEFLNIAPQDDFHNPEKFIELIESHILDQFDSELRDCLGLIDDRSYEDYIKRYIHQVSAHLKNDKIKNAVTGKFETSDMFFIKEFESNINLKDSTDDFRSHIISRLGAFSIDNPGKPIIYTDVFQDIVKLLKESFRGEQKKVIDRLGENLVYYLSNQKDALKQRAVEEINKIVDALVYKYNYKKEGAVRMLQYLIKYKY
jgi:predicted Ser/Thr protein kinase